MVAQQVSVYLPKFTMESAFNLTKTLPAMGMPDAFTPFVANFSGMDGMMDLYLSFVLHKAWVQVSEAGTEAAAVTIGGISTSAAGFPPTFRADHPFIFLIRDTQSGSILFLGRLANPSQSVPAAAPTPALTVTPSAQSLSISWPCSLTGLTLQQSPDLTNWTLSGGISSDGTNNFIILTLPSRNLFLRLTPQYR
jgi:hypothetical protein